MSPRLALASLVVALSLACGPLAPAKVNLLTATSDSCGAWTAIIDAEGLNDPLTLTQDGHTVGSWTVNGPQTFTAQGRSLPDRTSHFEASVGPGPDQVQTYDLYISRLDVQTSLSPADAVFAPEVSPSFDLSMVTPCPLANPRYSARTDTWAVTDQPVIANGVTHVVLPPAPRGKHSIAIDVFDGPVPLGQATAEFYVGAYDEDLDRDGSAGGLHGTDCDDANPNVNPEHAEDPLPNGIDDDCDGKIDEGTVVYDDDGDGLSENQGDCDDRDKGRYPGAPEVPDCRDQDCDTQIDEGVKLVESDDVFEPDDERSRAFNLETSTTRSFAKDITVTTRSKTDEEWFRFYSQDGDWDTWGIDVEVLGLPNGSTYDIEVLDSSGGMRGHERITVEHEVVTVGGAWLRNDSGDYFVHVVPVTIEKPWCPLTFNLWSR